MSKKNDLAKKKNVIEPDLSEIYKKKTHHAHILDLPDTYIGGIDPDDRDMWIYDEESKKIVRDTIIYIPGLYKIFDEIIVNSRDHTVRNKTCRTIKVYFNKAANEIIVFNDGDGIPIEIHKEEQVYIPELIFGHLLTSTNYDQKGKTVGGKNGYGAKLTNIYSTKFIVETVYGGKKYVQVFENNMYKIHPPIITDAPKVKSYTQITFIPDLKRFHVDKISDKMYALFQRRIYDIAACTIDNKVKVYLDNNLIEFKSSEDYLKMYLMNDEEEKTDKEDKDNRIVYDIINERWKLGVIYAPDVGFRHISMVNGISTLEGGTHINYISDQIADKIIEVIKTKDKTLKIKPSYVKDYITLYVECIIEDPAFSSQTKETLSNKVSSYGSTCDIPKAFIDKISKTGLIDEIMDFAKLKQNSALSKTDGKKVRSLRGLPKLEDAEWAGGPKSHLTRLILTEGDSAFAFAKAGMSVIGRERYGAFPLRGKLLNVREATAKQLLDNEEIQNLKKILGLKQNKKYKSVKELRYGGIMILTDQDHDGSHIKGLLMNFIHFFWPSLIKIKNFIQSIATPIVKTFKSSDTNRKNPTVFYSISEYTKWSEDNKQAISNGNWIIKYYKGLGTSKEDEAREVFKDFDKKVLSYTWDNENEDENENGNDNDNDIEIEIEKDKKEKNQLEDDIQDDKTDSDTSDDMEEKERNSKCHDSILLAFSKLRVTDRKKWLKTYNSSVTLDNTVQNIMYNDFINKELIHFSNYDNIRSIPAMSDGFKPSQRKVLYGSFMKGIKKEKDEIKVAQLAAYISEKTEYHHGETSLQGTIINMAQDFVGANNINLLVPSGNFGHRNKGGSEAASARYIFTYLTELTPLIFRKEDEQILDYIIEDGTQIEPKTYAPIIPTILVNGTQGIGTGFSSTIPSYNPLIIIQNIRNLLDNK